MPVRRAAVHEFSTLRYAVGLGRSDFGFSPPVAFRVGCRRPGTRPHDAIHGPHVFRALRAVMLTFLQLISSRSIPAGVVGRKDYLKGTKITATR